VAQHLDFIRAARTAAREHEPERRWIGRFHAQNLNCTPPPSEMSCVLKALGAR